MRVLVRPYPTSCSLALSPQETHVWEARLRDEAVAGLEADLTDEERERAGRYRHARPCEQFVRVRGLLRRLLGYYLGEDPRAVPIVARPDGKPVLAGRHLGLLEFNVSHTEGMAVFAVGPRPVGVDVEAVREVSTADGLVGRFFTPAERGQYENLPVGLRPAAFLRGWTCKEAVLKGLGIGARDLDRCVVDLDPRRPVAILGPARTAATWSLAAWEPDGGYVAAVAVEWSGSALMV